MLADHSGGKLSKSTHQVIAAAQKLNPSEITVAVIGKDADSAAQRAASIPGVTAVMAASVLEHPVADSLASVVSALVKKIGASHVLGSTSSVSKDVLPRVGALMDIQPISDVIEIESESRFKRPMYAGNVIATVESAESVKILTIRPTAFNADLDAFNPTASPVTSEKLDVPPSNTTFISEEVKKNDKPDLATASIVVAGGRGLKSKENFESVLNPLCDKLKAGLGASRAAVDAGYAPNDLQVGQTGKIVAPDLYIAVGISGAIQHLAGMKDSRTIVAINKDKDAPIFQIADYGLVGDLFEIVPDLVNKL